MLFCIGITIFATLLVGRHIIREGDRQFNFLNLVLLILAGTNGVVMVRDIFSLYVFIEITAVTTFTLIAFYKKPEALEGAFKYIVMSVVASVLMLSGIALVMLISGGMGFDAINRALRASPHSFLISFAIAVFISGLLIKSGLMPFHGWLPDAYAEAPAPVTILLAGIVTKTVGLYTLIRFAGAVFSFQHATQHVLMLVGAASIVLGAVLAAMQSDMKRMLAYSSISQMGYVVLSLGTGTTLGMTGAVFQLFHHTIFKSLLFINATAVELKSENRSVKGAASMGGRMPVTALTSVIGSLSAAGVPPLGGFWSKFIIVLALFEAGHPVYAFIAILASVLTLAYLLILQRKVFFNAAEGKRFGLGEEGFGLLLPALLLAAASIAVGLFFPMLLGTFLVPMATIGGL
jgi:multicomponent Na+:H+ antiporter subunit D